MQSGAALGLDGCRGGTRRCLGCGCPGPYPPWPWIGSPSRNAAPNQGHQTRPLPCPATLLHLDPAHAIPSPTHAPYRYAPRSQPHVPRPMSPFPTLTLLCRLHALGASTSSASCTHTQPSSHSAASTRPVCRGANASALGAEDHTHRGGRDETRGGSQGSWGGGSAGSSGSASQAVSRGGNAAVPVPALQFCARWGVHPRSVQLLQHGGHLPAMDITRCVPSPSPFLRALREPSSSIPSSPPG